jgi:SAM-dependent methyltransferase
VQIEMAQFRSGVAVAPFAAMLRCWKAIPWAAGYKPSVLDVGAASGAYGEILNTYDIRTNYTACDFSEHFAKLAAELYPEMEYEIADAQCLPFLNNSFDAVISTACIMHVLDYPRVIREIARVADMFAVLNKTPLAEKTTYFRKEAYGVPCLEIHFNETEFLGLCKHAGLDLIYSTQCGTGARSYVFKKYHLHHHQV